METKPTYQQLVVQLEQLKKENESLKIEKSLQEQILLGNSEKLEYFFRQSLLGIFFMMLDEPIEWNEHTDKEKMLDYIFEHQRVTEVNKAMLDQYRAKEEEFVGHTPSDFFQHNIEYGKEVWREFFDAGHLKIDTDEMKLDGTPMTIEGDYICIYDEKGRITGHFGVQQEVTKERDAIIKLKEREANFKLFFNTIPSCLFIISDNGYILEVNDLVIHKLGYTRKELIGRHASIFCAPEKRLEVIQIISEMKAGIRPILSIPLCTKDYKLIPAESTISRGKWNGENVWFCVSKDLSDLSASEEKFSKAFQNSPAILALINNKSEEYVEVNQTFYDKFEVSQEDVIGQKSENILIFSNEFKETLRYKLSENGRLCNIETLVQTQKGKELNVLFSSDFIDILGESYCLTTAIDITERKKIEQELKNQKNRLDDIIEATNVGTWEWNIQTGACVFDDRWAEMIGYSINEVDPPTVGFWIEQTQSDDFLICSDLLIKHFARETEFYEAEYRMKHKDGSWVWILDKGKVTQWDDNGKPLLMYGTHQDITAKKKAELLLQEERNLFSSGPVFILEWEPKPNWPVRFASENVKDVLGYTSKEMMDSEFLFGDYMHPDDLERIEKEFYHFIRNGICQFEQSYRIRKENGKYIWVYDFTRVQLDEKNDPVSIRGYLFDQTHAKEAENKILELNQELQNVANKLKNSNRELKVAKEAADESNRLKSAFLANMSHEIRTPMNAIVGFAQLFKRNNQSPDKINRFADIILQSSNHLLNLINDIIDISKIDAGQANAYITEIDLNKALADVNNIIQSQIDSVKKEVELISCFTQEEFYIKTDKTRLQQILLNLLGNAIKFTDKGNVKYGYEVRDKDILFFVKDTGIGISREKQKYIFDRFRQGSVSTEVFYGGTGLGLSIAKACAELLNGTIWCKSTEGKGATFYFTIEFCEGENCEENYHESLPEAINFNGEHILIAEDDDINFKYIVEIFENQNITITRTKTGSETIQKVLEGPDIDLILMDIQMPTINGWEATREIRKHKIEIPIIAQTAYAFETDREESFEAGCTGYITKPTEPEKLLQMVYQSLQKVKC